MFSSRLRGYTMGVIMIDGNSMFGSLIFINRCKSGGISTHAMRIDSYPDIPILVQEKPIPEYNRKDLAKMESIRNRGMGKCSFKYYLLL